MKRTLPITLLCLFFLTTVHAQAPYHISLPLIIGAKATEPPVQSHTVIWADYWHFHDWHLAFFKNYLWKNGWEWQDGKITTYGVQPSTSIPKYDENGVWENVWRLQFSKPENCPQCYWGSGLPFNDRVYMSNIGDYYVLHGESRTYTGDGERAMNDGLGLYGEGVHDPHASPYLANFYRIKGKAGDIPPYIFSPSGTSDLPSCADGRYTTTNGPHTQYYYEDTTPATFGGGAPLIATGIWRSQTCWLGLTTFGPYTGNVVIIQQFEEYGKTPPFVETWFLMENIGLVQIEQADNTWVPRLKMTICSLDQQIPDCYQP